MEGQVVSSYTFSSSILIVSIFFLTLSAWTMTQVNKLVNQAIKDYPNFISMCGVDPYEVQRLQMFTYFTVFMSVIMILAAGYSIYNMYTIPRFLHRYV
jgi:hypothetical protein